MTEPKGILKNDAGTKPAAGGIQFDGTVETPNRKPLSRELTTPPQEKQGEEKRKQIKSKGGAIKKSTDSATVENTNPQPGDEDDPEKCIIS